METPFGAREWGAIQFFFQRIDLELVIFLLNRRIREFPCCRANILEKGRGFPRKLFEVGAMTSH
jgi:hypothetical protein